MPLQLNRGQTGEDGTVRKAHYGDGRQPWDDMVDLGWAAHFAAASILKYLRRSKDPEHSLESAQWYYNQLYQHAAAEAKVYPRPGSGPWERVLGALEKALAKDELKRLRNGRG